MCVRRQCSVEVYVGVYSSTVDPYLVGVYSNPVGACVGTYSSTVDPYLVGVYSNPVGVYIGVVCEATVLYRSLRG